jgi:hypothetical protein
MKTFEPRLSVGQVVINKWGSRGDEKNGTVICFVPANVKASDLHPDCKDKLKGLYDSSTKARYLVQLDNGNYALPYAGALEKNN